MGNVVTENLLRAVSSDVPRTKMSLQLVLASLFPPRDAQKWNNRLNWQPIPTYYLPSDKDTIFYGSKCNENRDMFNKFKKTDNFISTMSNYTSLIGYVANKTGLNIPSFYPLLKLYFNLVSEVSIITPFFSLDTLIYLKENFGLRLPKWTKKIYPHPLNETPGIYYTQVSASNEAKQYSGGFLLKNIINEMQSQIKGAEPKERKIYLYSGHEINVAYILILLGVYDMRPPPLGSFVILELHKLNTDNFGVKVLYQNYEEIEPKLLHLPGCEKICEFNKFLRNVQNFLPEDNLKCSGMNDVV